LRRLCLCFLGHVRATLRVETLRRPRFVSGRVLATLRVETLRRPRNVFSNRVETLQRPRSSLPAGTKRYGAPGTHSSEGRNATAPPALRRSRVETLRRPRRIHEFRGHRNLQKSGTKRCGAPAPFCKLVVTSLASRRKTVRGSVPASVSRNALRVETLRRPRPAWGRNATAPPWLQVFSEIRVETLRRPPCLARGRNAAAPPWLQEFLEIRDETLRRPRGFRDKFSARQAFGASGQAGSGPADFLKIAAYPTVACTAYPWPRRPRPRPQRNLQTARADHDHVDYEILCATMPPRLSG